MAENEHERWVSVAKEKKPGKSVHARRRGFPPPLRYAPLRRETSQGIRTDKKELRKCRTGARIKGVKSAEVARGLL